ncbi:unnamed protein product, partial [Musa hybrid cultivar]
GRDHAFLAPPIMRRRWRLGVEEQEALSSSIPGLDRLHP